MPESVKDRFTNDFEYLYMFSQQGQYYFDQQFEGNANRNKRAVWNINTTGYKGAHFATFPPKFCATPILAGCPEFICTKCGHPRLRVYSKGFVNHDAKTEGGKVENTKRLALLRQSARAKGGEYYNSKTVIGLSDCCCGAPFVPGVCMDPFGGSGTLAVEARKLGRKAILIDISPEYCDMAVRRIAKLAIPAGMK